MSLRTRLIVAFFTLSVVPLGAVTFYTYTSNVRALREAAEHEADLLAGELGQRMQLVTAQLSERVEHLMDVAELQSAVGRASAVKATAPAAAPPAAHAEVIGASVANALGEAAMLLNNVELQGLIPWTGGRQGRTAGRSGSATGAEVLPIAGTAPRPNRFAPSRQGSGQGQGQGQSQGRRPPGPPSPAPAPPPLPPAATTSVTPPPAPAGPPAPPPAVGRIGPPPVAPASPAEPQAPMVTRVVTAGETKDRIKIDMTQIRRELLREIIPAGKQLATLTPEERERLGREMSQRMLGVVTGLQLGAAELKKQAEAAKREADAKAKASQTRSASSAVAPMPAPAPALPSTPPIKDSPVPAKMKKSASLSGNRLDVKYEHDGKVVQQVNAEVNFANVLATVFSTTRRDRGEVPFAVGRDGQIYTRSDDDRRKVEGLGAIARPNGPLTARLDDWIVVTTEDPSGSGLRLGIARPVGDSLDTLRRTAARNAGLGGLFILIALAGIVPLSTRLTRNLSALGDGVRRIAQGDYTARVPVRAKDEVGELAQAFNQMAEDVEKHQRAALGQERIKRELELGRQIQHDMLPHAPLKLGLTEIKGVSVPAREVGGDFFNYFVTPGGQIALLVGDVSGKGVGAALLMANIQASLRTRLALGQDLSELAREIDYDIEANSPGPVYATLFVGILDPPTRVLRYVNAGHHPQYVLHEHGRLDKMASTGLPVGLYAGHGFREQQLQLAAGDLLFFYTDGCVEAENAAGDMFGAERLEALLVSAASSGSDEMLARVESAVNSFRGASEQFDDATMMAVQVG
ncbi:MAG TPA: SpoIIE family protein phosphatase [Vicinamibacterales bacterium]|nr:SpoIIE family protein phosphatase [Vicinamibacterales bacterium]